MLLQFSSKQIVFYQTGLAQQQNIFYFKSLSEKPWKGETQMSFSEKLAKNWQNPQKFDLLDKCKQNQMKMGTQWHLS